MLKIQSGRAHDVGIKYWEIVDAAGSLMTEFNARHFDTIVDGADVYFIDLDVDPLFCENVQSQMEVDAYVQAATPAAGIAADADPPLRIYIMEALLFALKKQGTARTKYHEQLRAKMLALAAAAGAAQLTRAQLRAAGIMD